ncbi:MAG: hypothetical protein ACK5MZ_08340 [Aestuariibaculum sp.]
MIKKCILTMFWLFSITVSLAQSQVFPDDFIGVYKGDIEISNIQGKQKIAMEFHLTKTDTVGTYRYTLVYNNKPRHYFLIEKDKEKGQYIIDENNGIILPVTVFNQTVYSIFEVNGNLITTTEHFYNDYMDFEIMLSKISSTGVTGKGTKEIPEVITYPIWSVQRARLKKQ